MRYLVIALPLLLAACATPGTDSGNVSITTATNGQQFGDASCVVTTRSGTWNIVTPATLPLGRSDGDLRIVCQKPGYRTSELILPPYSSASGSSVGFGAGGGSGNVGMGVGFSFPLSGGAGYYPSPIVINMNPL
jgi:hypothetical protein